MLEITRLAAHSLDLDHIDVYWEIKNIPGPASDQEPHEILDYDFYILRSGDSPAGPYEQIGGPFRDTYRFRDITVSLLHKWRAYYYKIKVIHRSTSEEKEFGPVASQQAEKDLIAIEVIRQEDILFREFVGRRCWLYPIRTFGPRCSCWDSTLARRTRSKHFPCFDTGFFGGYMSPIEVFVQIDPSGQADTATPLQKVQQNDTTARMICFPQVSPNDILVEAENRRWRVIKITPTQRLRSVVRQELQLHEIPKGDIEFGLPLQVNLESTQLAANRNFTNSATLTKDDQYSDILAAYGNPRGSDR